MSGLDLDSGVPDWLIEHPQLLRLFQSLKIDYCCGGKSLRTACLERCLQPEQILERCQRQIDPAAR